MKCKLGILLWVFMVILAGCGGNVDQPTNVNETSEGDTFLLAEAALDEAPGQTTELKGRIICVDAGHGITGKSGQEPMAPNTSETKPAHVSGTKGSLLTEEQLNLAVALKLEKELQAVGATVVMTRTTAESDMSNIDRAKLANEAKADICVRIHADGSDSTSASGMSMLVPTTKYMEDETLVSESRRAGEIVLRETLKATGAKDRGISQRSDMTGFNWSTVPVILIEMGFMSNPEEDRLLSAEEYQDKIVKGIVNGLIEYFDSNET